MAIAGTLKQIDVDIVAFERIVYTVVASIEALLNFMLLSFLNLFNA